MEGYTEPTPGQWRSFLENGKVPSGGNIDVNALRQTYPSLILDDNPSPHIAGREDFSRALAHVYGRNATLNLLVHVGTLCMLWLRHKKISPAPTGEQIAYFRWLMITDHSLPAGGLMHTIYAMGTLTDRDVADLRWIVAGMTRPADRDADNNVGPALDVQMAAHKEKRRRFIHALNAMREAVRGGIMTPDVTAEGKFVYPDLEEKVEHVTQKLEEVKKSMSTHHPDGVVWKGLETQAKQLFNEREALVMEQETRARRYRVFVAARDVVRMDPYFDDGFVVPATLRPYDTENLSVLWRVSAREAKKDMAVLSLQSTFGQAYATREEQREAVESLKKKRRTDELVTGTYHSYYSVDESTTPVDPRDFGAYIVTAFGGSVLNKI